MVVENRDYGSNYYIFLEFTHMHPNPETSPTIAVRSVGMLPYCPSLKHETSCCNATLPP